MSRLHLAWGERAAWFVLLWAGGVAAPGLVALLFRVLVRLAAPGAG